MAFFRLVLYASKLNRITQKLIAEKEAATAISRKEKPKYGWRLRLSHLWINCKRRLNNCLINSNFLKNTVVDRFFYRLRKYGSLENYILKSILGFVGGYVLTYLLFFFLAVQLNVRLSVATLICCFLGCILTIGLAFSQNIRCIVFLTLPQFFSKRGRQALIAYALILTMLGPAKNTLNNLGIMSESLACGQEQLKSAVKQILDVIKKPFVAIKDALKAVVKAVKEVIKKIKEILVKIKRVIMAIIGVIKSVFEFLGAILNLCNKELGTPYQRCSRVFESAISDCQAALGSFFSWACSIGYLLNTVCYLVKPFDLICLLVDFISNSIIGVVIRKIKIFIRHVKTMFYVKIKFSHSYHFESKSSKSMRDIARSIVEEVKMKTRGIVSVFEFFNCAASLFFIFLISRHQFLTKERFDNKFLTKNLVDIDLRRAAMDKETIFPLNHRERKKFITIQSVRLLPKERKELSEGLGFLMSTALKIGTHMAIDYSLFWIMNLIRKYGKFQSKVQAPNIPTVNIAGEGLLADLLKAVVKSFQPLGINLEIDTVPCLPIPIPPDLDRYVQIASILFMCLLLTIFEPYGLRWRNWILCYYYPRRAKERAVWLYNHILRSRSSFLKFARRQLRRKLLGGKNITKVTCLEYLRSKTNNKFLLFFLGSDSQQACLLCGDVFRESDKEKPIRCQRPGCTAMYCRQCFEDLENMCTVCQSPIEYGDLSDFSEERDSSDEEYTIPSKPEVETEEFDSGMTTDEPTTEGDEGSTDDYSYSYQESKKVPSTISVYKKESSRDLEKQSSPDYVSMQYFDDEMELYSFKPYGFEDKDEETQFPIESSSLETLDRKPILEDTTETSSIASIIKEDKNTTKRSQENKSCMCLNLDSMRDPASQILLDELKQRLSSISSARSNSARELQPIQEQTEDEALIQFSTDEETEMKSTIFEDSSFTARSHVQRPVKQIPSSIESPKETITSPDDNIGNEKFLSDSELSENDVKKLIGKPASSVTSTQETSSDEDIKNEAKRPPEMSSKPEPPSQKPSSTEISSNDEESQVKTKVIPSIVKVEQLSSTKPSKISNPSLITQERHIEFIGLQKKKTRTSTDSSSENEKPKTKRTGKYRSTISTKTSKQDVSGHTKDRKSILKVNSASSVLSEIKELQEKVTVPKLNLKSLEDSDSETITPSKQSHRHQIDSFDLISKTLRPNTLSHFRNSRKTNKTEKRLKGGSNIPFSGEEKFLQYPEDIGTSCRQSPGSQDISSPIYPFRSTLGSSPSTLSQNLDSLDSSRPRRNQPKSDSHFFESSDSSFSPFYAGTKIKNSFSYFNDFNVYVSSHSDSMTTDINTTQPPIEKSHSSIKSRESLTTKKSVRISETVEGTEETSDEGGEFEETDASSDLSISVQENILGIPRSKLKKREKINWKEERELSSEVVGVSESPEENAEKEELGKASKSIHSNIESTKSSDKTKLEENISGHELNDAMEQFKYTTSNDNASSSDHSGKLDKAGKFIMSGSDSRLLENRTVRKCRCCKCKDKLPITHHSPSGDPDRKILLKTGVDCCIQTSAIDRSDRSSQINFDTESTRDSFPVSSSNKRCLVRCKLKEDYTVDLRKPEKHCDCSVCRLRKSEENESPQIDDYCDNQCFQGGVANTHSQRKCSIPRKKTVGTTFKPQTCDQVCSTKKPYGKSETVYSCEGFEENPSREASNESICSDVESYRERLGLPYQNNDEYKRLVRELEEKLVARNRERVRKTMREFEKCSTRNQNLRRPVLYDDSSCGEEPILTKIVHLKAGDAENKGAYRRVCPPSSPKRQSVAKEMNTVETMQREVKPRMQRMAPRPSRYCYEKDPIHWQMDTATGEWYRVSDVNICDPYDIYEPESRYSQSIPVPRRAMMERYEEEPRCEDCDDLNRRYGHRYNILFCPRHRMDRYPPRHRRR
ncbi:uncharacterized protein LOC123677756 isoform X3 [Harmonia axyridis]|uniref:uncharacterized protein LOC123677756 isoform X3 n=1 Tax=Harmonia axyridis TaxID=115357 RepID=UPI001E275188|nr:uncharacterized protein LOC123677756 isoform X3 [Harmonia axyridis]